MKCAGRSPYLISAGVYFFGPEPTIGTPLSKSLATANSQTTTPVSKRTKVAPESCTGTSRVCAGILRHTQRIEKVAGMRITDMDFGLRRRRRARDSIVGSRGLIGRGRSLAMGRASGDQRKRERRYEQAQQARLTRCRHSQQPRRSAHDENSIGWGRLPPAL